MTSTDSGKTTLLVLAAGMGSRYGGLKQIDPIGPSGEVVLDYSVYDAIAAGFDRVVFLIRKEIEADFKDALADHFEGRCELVYAYQESSDLPDGYSVPEGRVKPWGTAHAIWACRDLIHEPFAVINADDFYGRSSFQMLYDHLQVLRGKEGRYCMVGFVLRNTLSENGGVARGICSCNDDGTLQTVVESFDVREQDGRVSCDKAGGGREPLSGDEPASMNMWGFTPDLFERLDAGFPPFLDNLIDPLKSEYMIPEIVDEGVARGVVTVDVLTCNDKWMGVTYPEDKPAVQAGMQRLIDAGSYPVVLWE